MQISEAVDGFVVECHQRAAADDYVAEEDFDEFDEEDETTAPAAGQGRNDQEARGAEGPGADEVRASSTSHFDKMRKAFEKEGYKSAYDKAQKPSPTT
jgi:RNA polymerase primary sigma factor